MNHKLARLSAAAFLGVSLCVLLCFICVQQSQYWLSPVPASTLQPPSTPSRPVAPLFNPAHAEELLEGTQRDKWQQPQKLVAALRLQPGEIVADIGAGSGYLMPSLSRSVGSQGCVFEEEIQTAFLPTLKQKARAYDNVHVLLGHADDPGLPQSSVDCFVLLTVYHEVEHPIPFLRLLHRYARPEARLAIIDFDANLQGNPPAPEGHWVAEQDVIREAEAAGWQLAERHDFLRNASQFYLVFRQRRN